MPAISIRGHFDGAQILLDEPYQIEPNAELLITVFPNEDDERESWFRFARPKLEAAYGEDEPDYPLSSITKMNPKYERR